jgi:predicted negative regulator of RcsB-dependent stress response
MFKDSRNIAAFICLVLLVVIVIFAWAIFRTNRLVASAQEMALQVAENAFPKGYLLPC